MKHQSRQHFLHEFSVTICIFVYYLVSFFACSLHLYSRDDSGMARHQFSSFGAVTPPAVRYKIDSLRNQSHPPRPSLVSLIAGVKVSADNVSMDGVEGNIPGLSSVSIFDYPHPTLTVSPLPSLLASLPARTTTPPCWPPLPTSPCVGQLITFTLQKHRYEER